MNLERALQTFIEESRELLSAMEDALLALESAPGDGDAINAVFRAMHTIKGSAGLFGLDAIVEFTHVAESVMDRVRSDEIAVDESLIALMLRCRDHLVTLIDDLASGQQGEHAAVGAALVQALQALLGGGSNATVAVATENAAPQPEAGANATTGEGVGNDAWHISVRFAGNLLRNGYDPLSFVRYLATLSEILHVEPVTDALPPAQEMDPEECYLGFEIRLAAGPAQADIEAAFEFVQDDCSLLILPPHAPLTDYALLIATRPEADEQLGALLVSCGALTEAEVAQVLSAADATPELVVAATPAPAVAPAAAPAARQGREATTVKRSSSAIRVDASKLDQLIDLVGELVIAGASAEVMARRSRDRNLMEANSSVSQLVDAIRDSALRLRMVEIGETFNRFRRVVRDVSQELGKEIELTITGAETELDKSVVERIGDPLMHLVRNAMDHGIETAEVRVQQGKPAAGSLKLHAYHDSGSIVIEISDDGRGLDKERILAKAQERGLVAAGQTLSDQEIYGLIFQPGFSTAEQVTNLSGRGVGMDVVRRNIDALRGAIELDSRPGVGTTVSIRLPLTLAIIEGFLVGVGEAAYIIPLDSVVECIELDHGAIGQQNYLNLRGRVLPFLRLRELFHSRGQPARRQNVVVVRYAGQSAGLVVDRLMGEFQTVIKPLGRMFRHLRGFAGSTILGSGEVALILDVQDLIRTATERHCHAAEIAAECVETV